VTAYFRGLAACHAQDGTGKCCAYRAKAQLLPCTFVRRAGGRASTFTRQRSLVRTQHRPLSKSVVLQVKLQNSESVAALTSLLLTTDGFSQESLFSTAPISGTTRDGHPIERCATTSALVVGQKCDVRFSVYGVAIAQSRCSDSRSKSSRGAVRGSR
jgi:hypothetical protein